MEPHNSFFFVFEKLKLKLEVNHIGLTSTEMKPNSFSLKKKLRSLLHDSLTRICQRATLPITTGCLTTKQVITKEQTTRFLWTERRTKLGWRELRRQRLSEGIWTTFLRRIAMKFFFFYSLMSEHSEYMVLPICKGEPLSCYSQM